MSFNTFQQSQRESDFGNGVTTDKKVCGLFNTRAVGSVGGFRNRVTDVQTETCLKLEKSEYLRGLRPYVTKMFVLFCSQSHMIGT